MAPSGGTPTRAACWAANVLPQPCHMGAPRRSARQESAGRRPRSRAAPHRNGAASAARRWRSLASPCCSTMRRTCAGRSSSAGVQRSGGRLGSVLQALHASGAARCAAQAAQAGGGGGVCMGKSSSTQLGAAPAPTSSPSSVLFSSRASTSLRGQGSGWAQKAAKLAIPGTGVPPTPGGRVKRGTAQAVAWLRMAAAVPLPLPPAAVAAAAFDGQEQSQDASPTPFSQRLTCRVRAGCAAA